MPDHSHESPIISAFNATSTAVAGATRRSMAALALVGMMLVTANIQALTTDIPLTSQVVFVTPNFDDLIIFSANFQSA